MKIVKNFCATICGIGLLSMMFFKGYLGAFYKIIINAGLVCFFVYMGILAIELLKRNRL
jgi:hypothetical protein